jgi:hypothetical protein
VACFVQCEVIYESHGVRTIGPLVAAVLRHCLTPWTRTTARSVRSKLPGYWNSYGTDCSRRDSLPSATVSVQFQGHLCIRRVTWAAGRPSKRWLSLLASGWMTGVLFPAARGFCFQHIVQTGFGGSPSFVCNSTEFLPRGKEAGA